MLASVSKTGMNTDCFSTYSPAKRNIFMTDKEPWESFGEGVVIK